MATTKEQTSPGISDKMRQWFAPILAGIVIFAINKIDKKLEGIEAFMTRGDSTDMRQNIRLEYIERKQDAMSNRQDDDHEDIQSLMDADYFIKPEEPKFQKPKTK